MQGRVDTTSPSPLLPAHGGWPRPAVLSAPWGLRGGTQGGVHGPGVQRSPWEELTESKHT